jgi:DNA polymerase
MLYKLAKARVLGLGYGCGAEKFVLVAKIMAGLDLSPADAQDYVNEFRQTNPRIVELWDRMGRALRQCEQKVWPIHTAAGRVLRYFNPAEGYAKPVKAGASVKFHGAKLVENLVQATARDVLADMVLRIETAGVPVVMHVHDEVIAEVPADEADAALSIITREMSTPPFWMPALPVACEARIAEVYGK